MENRSEQRAKLADLEPYNTIETCFYIDDMNMDLSQNEVPQISIWFMFMTDVHRSPGTTLRSSERSSAAKLCGVEADWKLTE